MRLRRKLVVAAALFALAQGVLAAEVSYDFVACTHGKGLPLDANGDIVAYGFEGWGVVASSQTREWENASTHCFGTMRIVGGKRVGRGLCKWALASGDTAIGEFDMPANGAQPTFTWLAGTGKLKGITGGGTFQEVFSAKAADPATSQGCRRDWGKYSTPS